MTELEKTEVENGRKQIDSITKILERGKNLGILRGSIHDSFMDYLNLIEVLDFDRLLHFDDFDFAHDVNGIYVNYNRQTYEFDNCFLPRCSK